MIQNTKYSTRKTFVKNECLSTTFITFCSPSKDWRHYSPSFEQNFFELSSLTYNQIFILRKFSTDLLVHILCSIQYNTTVISNIVFRFLARNCTLAELGPENKVFPTFFDLKFSSQIIKNAERAPQTNFEAFCYSRTFEKIQIVANRA